jgi:nitrite reductase/ring-hydroxylating ferredoxin subunit
MPRATTIPGVACLLLIASTNAYVSENVIRSRFQTPSTRRGTAASTTSLFMAKKRGMRLDRDLIGSDGTGGSSATSGGSSNVNWRALPASTSALPSEMDKVALLETQLPSLTNPATNPTGAVAVVRHGGKTYCFDSACPSCKIPLTKAKVTEQPPSSSSDSQKPKVVLSCDFCTATYDLATGARVEKPAKGAGGGLFAGVVNNIMSADPRSAGPLRLFKLSQQGGKLMIAID